MVAENIQKHFLRSAQQFRPMFELSPDRDGQVMMLMMMMLQMMMMVMSMVMSMVMVL